MDNAFVACRALLLDAPQTTETFLTLCAHIEEAFMSEPGQDALIDYALEHLARWPADVVRPLPGLWPVYVESTLAAPRVMRLANALEFEQGDSTQLESYLLEELCRDPNLRHVTRVRTSSAILTHDDMRALTQATFSEALLDLDLRYGATLAQGMEILTQPPSLPALRRLDLRYNHICDEGALAIQRAEHMTELRTLRLQRNGISDKGVAALADAPHLRHLRELDLRHNPITAAGAEAIASSPHLGQLKRLHLSPERIGPKGILALANSPHLSLSIRRLWGARA